MAFRFTCPECGQTSELEEKPLRPTLICPACAKDVPVEGPGGKRGPAFALILTIVAVIIGGLFIFIFITVQAKKAEEQKMVEQRKAEAAARLMEVQRLQKIEAARKRWKEATKVAERGRLKTEADFVKAISTLKNYNGGDPDEKASLIKQIEGYKTADITKLMAKLDAKAKVFGDQKEYMKAVSVYQDYYGDFKEDSEELRRKGAAVYFDLDDKAKKAAALARQKAEEGKKQLLNDTVSGLLDGKISDTITAFNASPYKNEIPEISKMVNNLTKVNDIVLDSFKTQTGKEIPVLLKEGKTTLKIKKVENGRVYAEFKKSNLTIIKKYSVKDLDDSEVMNRLGEFDKATAGLVGGIKAARRKKYDEAEVLFQATGEFALPLMTKLEELKVATPAVVKVEKKEKKTTLLPVEAHKIKVNLKVTKGGKKNMGMGEIEEIVTARLSVNNLNQQSIEGYSVTVIILGKSLVNKDLYKNIYQFQEVLKLDARDKLDKNVPVKNTYNEGAEIGAGRRGKNPVGVITANGSPKSIVEKSGHKYYSWLWFLQDPSGAVKGVKSRHSKFEKIADKIIKAGSAEFNDKGKGLNINLNLNKKIKKAF